MNRLNSVRTNCALMVMSVLAALAAKPTFAAPTTTAKVSVTTLEDYNTAAGEAPVAGSLRHALEVTKGPRVITFAVGGEILLRNKLVVKDPYVTIDGSSAPKPGITIERCQSEVYNTHDVTLRYLRFRSGDGFKSIEERREVHGNYDDPNNGYGGWRSLCVWADGSNLTSAVTVENCSIQSSTDDNGTVWGNCRKILFRNCLFSGGHFSHKQFIAGWPTGTTPILYNDWLTIDGCVFTAGPHDPSEVEGGRMPDATGGTLTMTRNIVVWPHNGSRFNARINMIGNLFIENPRHPWGSYHDRSVCVNGQADAASLFVSGNYVNNAACPDGKLFGFPNQAQADVPATAFRPRPWAIWPASSAVASDINATKGEVIDRVGCSLPVRDEMDSDVIEDTRAKVMPSCSATVNGDMNNDGQVNGQDAATMGKAVLCGSQAPGVLCHGDFNFNGFIDAADAAVLDSMITPVKAEAQMDNVEIAVVRVEAAVEGKGEAVATKGAASASR